MKSLLEEIFSDGESVPLPHQCVRCDRETDGTLLCRACENVKALESWREE